MKSEEIIINLLDMGITQIDIGYFIGVTRQTVANIKNGSYKKLSEQAKIKLNYLANRSKDEVEKILTIDKNLDNVKAVVFKGDSEYLDAAYEGISYMSYWLLDDKFILQEKYHKYYYGHMNNFYPRYNQAALFMRDTFNRRSYPLVTFQVDYKNNMITKVCIESFKEEYKKPEHNLDDIVYPISFEQFMQLLEDRIKPKTKFMLYKDYLDDDWQYIIDNIKKNQAYDHEVFDLSRLLNFFDNEQPYYGPLIEDALDQFHVNYSLGLLLKDCNYRAKKIIELINMISLEDLSEKKHDKSSMLFDSHGLKRDNNYMKNERRKLKGEIMK